MARADAPCVGCGGIHGGIVTHIRCLESALILQRKRHKLEIQAERNHPDRLRGERARASFEAWKRFGGDDARSDVLDKSG